MLLIDFINQLATDYPELHLTITLRDFIHFTALAAEIIARTNGTWISRSNGNSVVPFLRKVLNIALLKHICYDLWHTIAPTIHQYRVQPALVIQQYGHLPEHHPVHIPETTLVSPVKNCLLCKKRPKLHHRCCLDGYLYDLDGVHTIVRLITVPVTTPTTSFALITWPWTDTTQMSFRVDGRSCFQFQPSLHAAPTVLPAMSEITCQDGSELHVLLNKADSAYGRVTVDTYIQPEKRYEDAMKKVLEWIALEGTKHHNHACSGCVQIVPLAGEQAKLAYIRAVVTNGITIGHSRCTATSQQLRELAATDGLPPPKGPCTTSLTGVHDRFCGFHEKHLGRHCQAQPCTADALEGTKTCKEHVESYSKFKARVTGNFALTSILHRPGSNRPSDPTVHQDWNTAELVGLEDVQEGDEADRVHEAVAKVEMYVWNHPGTRDILSLRKRERGFYPEDLSKTNYTVDPFHFRGHKASDDFCQHYTDPKRFPELQKDGNWVFNSSAAEMTNIWYGGFALLAQSMSAIRFNFMMEDMIERRNEWLIQRLSKSCILSATV
ncbi:uncharacterized protein MELLADRAFT_92190 [Melampsora larici-populina 98AG31]|uniref:CxC6 like cysteine cluster associated with KDZ domain-containing protein n=1 Tax=Melampsora larici-populina (strain 98AG31 / pathotype 3-4-7) TaxID=747676 RepID=F4S1U6_MELLP|nr:uncharacterized protein MELLADRAFT_92190 [Melampsora larici-populina 98AG31]EGG01440.1 hypothetical protein MELLADRAFT_92190 [Melampsora larici-populina 98AG31]